MDIEQEIQNIKNRNQKVEIDKAWEVSLTRRLFIAAVTYGVALAWLGIIEEQSAWLKAFVPVAGYALSTLSLPFLKNWWSKKHFRA
jgi:hypothetical protein